MGRTSAHAFHLYIDAADFETANCFVTGLQFGVDLLSFAMLLLGSGCQERAADAELEPML